MTRRLVVCCVCWCLLAVGAYAGSGTVTFVGQIVTLAGNGTQGFSGDSGPATQAELGAYLSGTVKDAQGNLYICDAGDARIRKVDTNGIITTFAGNGTPGHTGDGGPATSATLNGPDGIVVDSHGNVFFSEFNNFDVREVDTTGTITTFANLGTYATDIAIDKNDNLYVTEHATDRVVKIGTTGVSIFAGNGSPGYSGDGGPATSAQLSNPNGVSVDAAGIVYIADANNDVIRKVDTSGTITTFAGNGTQGYTGDGGAATSATFRTPAHPGFDPFGNVYIPDTGNAVIRYVDPAGIMHTFAGVGTGGYTGDLGPALNAELNDPISVNFDAAGNLYYTDSYNNVIRQIQAATAMTTAASATSLTLQIQNTGSAAVNLSGISVSAPYALQGGTCTTSAPLPVGSICTIGLTVAASSGAPPSGLITVTSDAANSPTYLSLDGAAVPINTSTALSASASAIVYGQPVTVTATVTSNSGTPTGSVVFTYSSPALPAAVSLPAVTLDGNGHASATVTLPGAASYSFGAIFTGTGQYASSSASSPLAVIVSPAATATTIVSSSNPLTVGGTVVFSVTVASSAGTPPGTVTLFDGTTQLGAATLSNGAASYSTSSLAAGTHNITATYAGSSNYAASSSPILPQTVNSTPTAPFQVTPGTPSMTVLKGQPAVYPITLKPASGFSGSVSFSCAGLPRFASCDFVPPTVTVQGGGGAASTTLTIRTANVQLLGLHRSSPLGLAFSFAFGFALMVPAARSRRGRAWILGLILALALCAAGLTGCGYSPSSAALQNQQPAAQFAPSGTYTVTVTGTSGTMQQSTNVTLVIQ